MNLGLQMPIIFSKKGIKIRGRVQHHHQDYTHLSQTLIDEQDENWKMEAHVQIELVDWMSFSIDSILAI